MQLSRKHIIITELFEFGGSNAHLKTLIKYLGKENIILVLEHENQLAFLGNIVPEQGIDVRIKPGIHKYAHLQSRFSTNVKELYYIITSIIAIQLLSMRNGFAAVTINAVKPEKHLYLFWLPFCHVNYILHTTPHAILSAFTSFTCNFKLNTRNRLITVSKSNKELLCQEWSIRKNKQEFIHVIYNCIIEKPRITTQSAGSRKYILTLGHVVDYKNPHVWLKVAKQVTALRDDIGFVWLGDGPEYEYFKKETSSSANISFAGFVTDTQSYFNSALIYYQPSLHETHGISVIEAMANHLPCIVAKTGGLTESVTHQYNGLVVDPSDIAEHVAEILALLDDPDRRSQYGSNGYQKYQSAFNYELFSRKMDSLYQEVRR